MCTSTQQQIPKILIDGMFLIPSAAQMEMGSQKFTTILDAFGKMTKVYFKDDANVCFETSMLPTKFYNRSRDLGHVAPGVFFTETDPPRKCEIPECNQIAMMTGKVDNTYVNTVHVNNTYYLVTDSHIWIEFDPKNLHTHNAIEWNKKDNADLHITELGSAHPLRRPNHPNSIVALKTAFAMMPGMQKTLIEIYSVDSDTKPVKQNRLARFDTNDMLLSSSTKSFTPYMHSFGLTENFAIIPIQPVHMDFMKIIKGTMLNEIFEPVQDDEMPTSMFVVSNLTDGTNIRLKSKSKFWYVHTVNAFETGSDLLTIDLTTSMKLNPLKSPAVSIQVNLNETQRDEKLKDFKMIVTRFELNLTSGNVTETQISQSNKSTDFPRINSNFLGRPYCYYYANEWFHHNENTYGSMAVVKQNTCSGERLYWYREGWFPSEPYFVPNDQNDAKEDDGILIFTATHGVEEYSSLFMLDAHTMQEISEVKIPGDPVTFTTHGEFFF